MFARHLTVFALLLSSATILLAAPHSAVPDSDLDQAIGHWVASGVSFQSGNRAHPFAIDIERVRNKIQVTLPPDIKLKGGLVCVLARTGAGVFRHVDAARRIVELSLPDASHATLLITGSDGDGRVTWQLGR